MICFPPRGAQTSSESRCRRCRTLLSGHHLSDYRTHDSRADDGSADVDSGVPVGRLRCAGGRLAAAALGARQLDVSLRVSHVPRRSRVERRGFGNASCERRWQQGRVLLGRDVLLRGVRGRQRLSHLDVSRAAVARRASVASKRGAHSTSVAAELTRSVCCTTGLTSRRATRPRSPRA